MNIRAKSANHIKELLLIYYCQVAKYNCLDIGNIDNIGENIISLWQKIICPDDELLKKDIDIDYNYDNSNISSPQNHSIGILEPIIDKIEMSEEYLTKIKYNRLNKNSQAVILYNNIQNWLFLNHLQKVVVEKALNYAILNKRNKCHYRSDQLLLYVREEKGVRKNRVVKAIYLEFNFLKRQTEFLIAAPTGTAAANIGRATIYGALSMNKYI